MAEYDVIGLFHNPPILNTTLPDWAGVNASADAMITVCLCGAMVYTGGGGGVAREHGEFCCCTTEG